MKKESLALFEDDHQSKDNMVEQTEVPMMKRGISIDETNGSMGNSSSSTLFPELDSKEEQETTDMEAGTSSHSAETEIMVNHNDSTCNTQENDHKEDGRRSVFSGQVKQKYGCQTTTTRMELPPHSLPADLQTANYQSHINIDKCNYNAVQTIQVETNLKMNGKPSSAIPAMRESTPPPSPGGNGPPLLNIDTNFRYDDMYNGDHKISPITPQTDVRKRVKDIQHSHTNETETSHLLTTIKSGDYSMDDDSIEEKEKEEFDDHPQYYETTHKNYHTLPYVPKSDYESSEQGEEEHYTIHAQTFILSLAFLFVWSPQNLMAPNLTQMGQYFHFDSKQRDLYLGANIAFATGVLSLPVSAFIGFLADMVPSRKRLFAGTVLAGGASSIWTGLSTTYTQLYVARFLCGGCMAGCVPIAFSLLGDLFDAKDRNAASSGLTAMMGAGILFGQVYAGAVGDTLGWKHSFYVSGCCSMLSSLLVLRCVKEPVRGGKEKVLQDMIAMGTKYEKKLTLAGFFDAMTKNQSNILLMLQGFTGNIPWGILFTFLNDYLSQERHLSVQKATYLVFLFGIGCAAGGIFGGYLGSWAMQVNRRMLPLFMAVTTFLGIFPFLGLLDAHYDDTGFYISICTIAAGCIGNLPSVNVRPCLINVNPPETRGATLTAANLLINLARGAGPSAITIMGAIWGMSRQYSMNYMLIVFWTITSILLLALMITLPRDQDAMDAELKEYSEYMIKSCTGTSKGTDDAVEDDMENSTVAEGSIVSIVSIEERMTSFDGSAARESIGFLGDAFREIGEEMSNFGHGGSNRKINAPSDQIYNHRRSKSELNSRPGRRKQWQSSSLNEQHQNGMNSSYQLQQQNYDFERGPMIDYSRGTRDNSQSIEAPTLL